MNTGTDRKHASFAKITFVVALLIAFIPADPIYNACAGPVQELKISHQFPGGTITEGDFRGSSLP